MLATFYSFNKRKNSTKAPQTSDITISGDVRLKAPTSLHEPIIVMSVGAEDMLRAMASNYMSMGEKFYWITNTTMLSKDHVEFHCKIDVLSTYAKEILETNAYVIRSTSHGNVNIADPYILATAQQKYSESFSNMTNMFMPEDSIGWTIVNVCSIKDKVTTYLLDSTVTPQFMSKICSPDFMEQLSQYISNPFDYIVSVYQCPFALSAMSKHQDGIIIGNYLIDDIQGAEVIDNNVIEQCYTVKVPRNYNDFRAISPISKATLFLPFVGTVDIDTARLKNTNEIIIEVFGDIRTGDIIYQLNFNQPNETEIMAKAQSYSGNCYSQIPIARTNNDIQSLSQSIVGLASTLLIGASTINKSAKAMEMAIPTLAATAGFTITSGIAALEGQTSMKGQISSYLGKCLGRSITLMMWSNVTSCEPSDLTETIGNPTNGNYLMSELSGYVQTQNFSLQAKGNANEIDEVNLLMDGGVYLE